MAFKDLQNLAPFPASSHLKSPVFQSHLGATQSSNMPFTTMNYCMFLAVPMFGMPFLCQAKFLAIIINVTVLSEFTSLFSVFPWCFVHHVTLVQTSYKHACIDYLQKPQEEKSASIMPTQCRNFFRKHLAWKLFFPYLRPRVFYREPLTSVNFRTDKESMWLEQTVVQSGHWRIVSIL